MKFYTQFDPPASAGEVFKFPSLTDELADEPLADIVRRFSDAEIVGGYLRSKSEVVFDDKTTPADVEAAFDDFAAADLPLMSKVEQAEALVDAQNELERLTKAAAAKRKNEPVKPPKLPEEEAASTDSQVA